jgi:FKBP-type peptidyl-prolyl cis-trans isomerase
MKKLLLTVILVLALSFTSCNTSETTMDNGLIIEDIKVGEGEEVKSGDTIKAHYKGWLEDGTEFDSSYDRGEPATFPIGLDFLVQGWEEGIPGMKEGGTRKLTIPSDLGYGDTGNPAGGIPGGATLYFEIELLEIL